MPFVAFFCALGGFQLLDLIIMELKVTWPVIIQCLSLVEITAFRLESKFCKGLFWEINFPPMRALKFLAGHVTYNPAYTYKFQLKTTKEIISSCTFFWLLFKITCLENSILSSTSCHLSCLRLKLPLLPLVPPLRAFHNQNQDQNQDLEVGNPGSKIRITAGDNVIINSLFVIS